MQPETKMILQALQEFREEFSGFQQEVRTFQEKTGEFQEQTTAQLEKMETSLDRLEQNQPADIISLLQQMNRKIDNHTEVLNKRVFRVETDIERLLT